MLYKRGNMKRLIFVTLLGFLTACGSKEVKKIVEDEKLQNDSEAVVEDLFELGESIVKDELNMPNKGKEDAAQKGK
jgi:hypothetical protein